MNNSTETKVVKYLGNVYEVPLWAKYIAADLDGDIYIYEQEPHWTTVQWYSKEGDFECVYDASQGTPSPCLTI